MYSLVANDRRLECAELPPKLLAQVPRSGHARQGQAGHATRAAPAPNPLLGVDHPDAVGPHAHLNHCCHPVNSRAVLAKPQGM